MNDNKSKEKALTEQLKTVSKELNDLKTQWDKPYECLKCKDKVSYTFIMPIIKQSGLCPTCFHER